jgi:hypothetical protein
MAKAQSLSKRELERRLQKLAVAFQAQKQDMVEKRNLAVLLAAKLYNMNPDDEIFGSFTTEYKKVVVELAEGLKTGKYGPHGEPPVTPNNDVDDGIAVHDIMNFNNPIKGYYIISMSNEGQAPTKFKIADRRNAGEYLDDKAVLNVCIFNQILTEDSAKLVQSIVYEIAAAVPA